MLIVEVLSPSTDYKGAEASVPIARLKANIPSADLYADAFDLE